MRDLAAWLLGCAMDGTTGTYNTWAVLPFGDWVALSRLVGGHTGPVVRAAAAWLLEHGIQEYLGEDSLAMWLVDADMQGWSSRRGRAGRRTAAPSTRGATARRAGMGARARPGPAAISWSEPQA